MAGFTTFVPSSATGQMTPRRHPRWKQRGSACHFAETSTSWATLLPWFCPRSRCGLSFVIKWLQWFLDHPAMGQISNRTTWMTNNNLGKWQVKRSRFGCVLKSTMAVLCFGSLRYTFSPNSWPSLAQLDPKTRRLAPPKTPRSCWETVTYSTVFHIFCFNILGVPGSMGQADGPETSPRFSDGFSQKSEVDHQQLEARFVGLDHIKIPGILEKHSWPSWDWLGPFFGHAKKVASVATLWKAQFKKRSWGRNYSRFRGLNSATPVEVLGIANVLNVNGWNFPSRLPTL